MKTAVAVAVACAVACVWMWQLLTLLGAAVREMEGME